MVTNNPNADQSWMRSKNPDERRRLREQRRDAKAIKQFCETLVRSGVEIKLNENDIVVLLPDDTALGVAAKVGYVIPIRKEVTDA